MNVKAQTIAKPTKARAVGRPRRLTTDQVLQAALSIGLDGLTMGAVAARLGVSITVLYGYVANRDELLRLASEYSTERQVYPTDRGQHWTIYIAEYAATLFTLLIGPGQLVGQYFSGGIGPEVEIDHTELWVEILTCRGFTVVEAMQLQRQVGEIVIGGAVTVLHKRGLDAPGVNFETEARRAMARRDPAQIPHLMSQQDMFARRDPVWQCTLLQVMEALSLPRNETLDTALIVRTMDGVLEQRSVADAD